jgi:hypothetical protein
VDVKMVRRFLNLLKIFGERMLLFAVRGDTGGPGVAGTSFFCALSRVKIFLHFSVVSLKK